MSIHAHAAIVHRYITKKDAGRDDHGSAAAADGVRIIHACKHVCTDQGTGD